MRKYWGGKIDGENARKEKRKRKIREGERERKRDDKEKRGTGCRDCCKEDRRNLKKDLVWFSFVNVACKDT